MNISGVLVHAKPAKIEAIKQALSLFDGVEVHAANEDGRMVVTLEAEAIGDMADTIIKIQNVDGVLSASMVYHQNDDLDDGTSDTSEFPQEAPCDCNESNLEELSQ